MKKAILTLLMIPAFVGMLFSCSEVKTDAKKLEGKWNIVEVKGEKILKEGLPNMEFDMKDNKVHGNAGCNIFNSTVVLDDQDISSITIYGFSGCNRFFGRYSTEGNTIKLEPGGSTMMACPDMEIEDAILKAMGNVKGVKAGQSENEMLLVDADGNVLMVLSKN
jgi:heat shock protein HslJ